MVFAIDWLIHDGEWEEARAERHEHGPGAFRDDWFWRRLTSLDSSLQLRHDATTMFPVEVLRAQAEDLRRWQAEHGGPVDPPITPADVFGWSTYPIALALNLQQAIWEDGFAAAPDDTAFYFRDLEGSGYLVFAKRGGLVHIASSRKGSALLRVPVTEFVDGVRDFIRRLVAQIETTAPELMDWPEVAALKV